MGDSYTIQISPCLISRLVGDTIKAKKKETKAKPKAQRETHGPLSEAEAASNNIHLPVSPTTPAANQELEAIRSALQESEAVVERLQKQEDSTVQELTQRAQVLHDKEFKLPYQKPMPCLDEKRDCKKCYEDHLKDTLKCAHLVKRFVDCAREARVQVNSSSG